MANLIESNKKLIEQTQNQVLQEPVQVNHKLNKTEDNRIKTITITKDASGFGFNVRGQISSKCPITMQTNQCFFRSCTTIWKSSTCDVSSSRPSINNSETI
jgi:hypothetical protein